MRAKVVAGERNVGSVGCAGALAFLLVIVGCGGSPGAGGTGGSAGGGAAGGPGAAGTHGAAGSSGLGGGQAGAGGLAKGMGGAGGVASGGAAGVASGGAGGAAGSAAGAGGAAAGGRGIGGQGGAAGSGASAGGGPGGASVGGSGAAGSGPGGAAGSGSAGGTGGAAGPTLQWTWLPARIGGPVQAVTLDGSGNVFAGLGVSGGIFRSTDDGASWQPSNGGMYGFTIGALAAAGTTIYTAAANLVRSVDDGASWLQLTTFGVNSISVKGSLVVVGQSTSSGTVGVSADGGNTFATRSVGNGAAADVEIVGSAILAATASGIYRSVDGGVTFAPVPGIMSGGLSADVRCDGVSTCYASAYDASTLYPALLTSIDAGATWSPLGMMNTRIVAVTAAGIAYIDDGTTGKLLRSDDGGQTWTPAAWPPSSSWTLPFATEGNRLFAPCIDGVYRSDDKAVTWTPASGSPATGAISGNAANIVVDTSATAVGTDGDIYLNAPGFQRSSDDGASWQVLVPWAEPYYLPYDCFVTGLGALECFEYRAPELVRSTDHGATWTTIEVNPPASSGAMQIGVSVAGNAGSTVYAGGSQGLARSDDDGLTFQFLKGSPETDTLRVLRDGHVLVQSGNATYRSVDKGATWQSLTYFPLPVVLEDGTGRLVYSGVGGSTSYSTDEGDSWTYYPNDFLPAAGQLAVDGTGRMIALIPAALDQFTNLGRPSVTYTSTDGGASWSLLTPQIPNPNVDSFAVDKRGRLLAATAGGLYRLDTVSPGP